MNFQLLKQIVLETLLNHELPGESLNENEDQKSKVTLSSIKFSEWKRIEKSEKHQLLCPNHK